MANKQTNCYHSNRSNTKDCTQTENTESQNDLEDSPYRSSDCRDHDSINQYLFNIIKLFCLKRNLGINFLRT